MRRCHPVIPLSTVPMAFASWQAIHERKLCKKVALVNSYLDRIQMKPGRRTLLTHSLTKPNSSWKFSFTKKEVHIFPYLVILHSSSLFWHDVIVTGIASIWRIWAEWRRTFFIRANLSTYKTREFFDFFAYLEKRQFEFSCQKWCLTQVGITLLTFVADLTQNKYLDPWHPASKWILGIWVHLSF